MEIYEFYQKQITKCDKVIEELYQEFDKRNGDDLTNSKKQRSKNASNFDLRQSLYSTTGIDFTVIPGLNELGVQTIISEVGMDMSKWPTENHFTSWLGLSPTNKITGGKVFDTKTRKVKNKSQYGF